MDNTKELMEAVDSRMYEEITKKGVTVYERDIAG